MTHAISVIPCLDIRGGRVVKGVQFANLRDAGDPCELAARYDQAGADEITFLDISATLEGRDTTLDLVRRTAEQVSVPLTVGGGVRSAADAAALLGAGASKVGVNSAAIAHPELLSEIADRSGSSALVVAIDVAATTETASGFEVVTHGGSRRTGIDAISWAEQVQERGAGAILLTSLDADGTQDGFDLAPLGAISTAVGIPVIASGGAGTLTDFVEAARAGAGAVLAASVFHFGTFTIAQVKEALRAAGFATS